MVARTRRNLIEHTTDTPEEKVLDRFPFRHPLDTGDRGALVLWAQSRLAEHGHYEGPLDGRDDREVSLAVRLFQSENSLKVTGVVDRKTWESL
jgi:peptidoglycan hydrolase-like protein with peptidoglycan-binding domain